VENCKVSKRNGLALATQRLKGDEKIELLAERSPRQIVDLTPTEASNSDAGFREKVLTNRVGVFSETTSRIISYSEEN
jgi:hypothetical protein